MTEKEFNLNNRKFEIKGVTVDGLRILGKGKLPKKVSVPFRYKKKRIVYFEEDVKEFINVVIRDIQDVAFDEELSVGECIIILHKRAGEKLTK